MGGLGCVWAWGFGAQFSVGLGVWGACGPGGFLLPSVLSMHRSTLVRFPNNVARNSLVHISRFEIELLELQRL